MDCKVNQQMILEVPVEGAPAPETSWWRDDAEVKSDDLIKVWFHLSCFCIFSIQ